MSDSSDEDVPTTKKFKPNNNTMSDSSDEDALTTGKFKEVNNIVGLQQKLAEIKNNLEWVEKLDVNVTLSAEQNPLITEESKNAKTDSTAESDFKREMIFYNQALSAANTALNSLHKLGIPTKRPTDYFAEMAKSDDHMTKVRKKLLNKQMIIERSEKVRAMREQKKHGKKIQQQVQLQKKSEKKKMINALKKTKKGKMSAENLLNEKKESFQKPKKKKSREFRDNRYGYGGKKKGSKYNTADSSAFYPGNKGKQNMGSKRKQQAGGNSRPRKTHQRRRR